MHDIDRPCVMSALPTLPSDASNLPIGQLESLKFKTTQIVESIQALQWQLEAGGQNVIPTWPDILSKYTLLLSQTHNLSNALVTPLQSQSQSHVASQVKKADGVGGGGAASANAYAKLALHPVRGLPDAQLDNELIPLLRNQQTTEVLRVESDTVRRLSARLFSSPSSSAPNLQNHNPQQGTTGTESYDAVLQACAQITAAHDARCERAVRAVAMLREKYEWRARVAVETEEPEEFVPVAVLSPNRALLPLNVGDGDVAMDGEDDDSGDDEEELEEVLGPSILTTPGADDSVTSTPREMEVSL